MDDISYSSKPIYKVVGEESFLTGEVVKHGFSKSKAIDYYANISNDLKNMLIWSGHTSSVIALDMKESIKLYDKIAEGLKDMWEFGDLDVNI